MRKPGLALVALATGALVALSAPASAKTFRYAYQGDAATMDPQALRETFTREFASNVMEALVRYDEKMQPEPALAASWKVISPTVWRFNLRRNVTFSNGNPFDADDVIFTHKRGSDPKSPFKGNVAALKEVRKVDSHTIDIDTGKPYPLLLRELTSMLIFDKEWVESHNAAAAPTVQQQESYLTRHALGTGPFILKSFQPDVKTVFVANPNWWDNPNKRHNLTEVIFRPIKSDATRVAALLSGEIDLIYPAPLQDLARIDRAAGTKVLEAPALRTLMVGMDLSSKELRHSNIKGKNPLKDQRVRQAIYQAIDIEAIKKKVMRGHAVPASTIMAPGINGYDPSLKGRLPYNPAASKKLLADAGYADGFSVGLDCPNDRYINDEEICTAMVAMLAKVGVKISLTAQTKSKHFKKMLSKQSDMFVFGWASSTTLDAHSFLQNIMHTPGNNKGNWNPGGYSNAKVDKLEGMVAKETDRDKRRALITEAFSIHKKEIGHIPIHTQTLVWAVRDGVDVIQPPNNVLWLRWVRKN